MTTKYSQQLEEFLISVERRAFRIAEMSTKNREDALDIVQDAMMQLVNKYANKPKEQWTPLFYRILNNRIMDLHRRNATQNRWRVWLSRHDDEDDSNDPIQDLAGEELGPDDMSDLGDSVERVNQTIQQLSLRQRQAFLLRAWEGLDVAETAQVMKCSEGSVKTHYSRALKYLRKQLESQL